MMKINKQEKGGFGYEVTNKYVRFYSVNNKNFDMKFGVGSRVFMFARLTIQSSDVSQEQKVDTLLKTGLFFWRMTDEFTKGGEYTQSNINMLADIEKRIQEEAEKAVKEITDAEDEANLGFVKKSSK